MIKKSLLLILIISLLYLSYLGITPHKSMKFTASIHLLAQKLEFTHSVTKENITIVAPAPKESVWDACK